MTEFANGVTGEAHLNHLGLQLTATASRINIVVVQASEENPLVHRYLLRWCLCEQHSFDVGAHM